MDSQILTILPKKMEMKVVSMFVNVTFTNVHKALYML